MSAETRTEVRLACPLCRQRSRYLFSKRAIGIRGCVACGHQFTDLAADAVRVDQIYDDDYFFRGGAGYLDYLSEGELLRSRGRRYADILRRFTIPGTMLDVGAAAGFVLAGLCDRGWHGEGVEPNQRMAQFAADEMGLVVHASPFELFQTTTQFDLVTLIQVLPHFYDPARIIREVAGILRPGGHCLIESWNRGSLTARLAGRAWHEYSPPSVLHWFDLAGFDRLMDLAGLGFVAGGRTTKWITGSHAKSLLRHMQPHSALSRVVSPLVSLVPDRLAIPYMANDLIWRLYSRPFA